MLENTSDDSRLRENCILASSTSTLRGRTDSAFRVLPVAEPEGGTLVEATDVRFGAPEDGKFQLRILLDASRRVVSAGFSFGDPLKGMGVGR